MGIRDPESTVKEKHPVFADAVLVHVQEELTAYLG